MAYCAFSNDEIPKGTGTMFVLRDGTVLHFCNSKCMKNYTGLKREGRLMKWTSKILILSTEKKAVEKKESAFAKEIEAKLAASKAPAKK